MAYYDWHSDTKRYTSQGRPFLVGNGFPLDSRTLRDSFSEVLSIEPIYIYPGLKVFTEENKEYVFTVNHDQNGSTHVVDFTGLREYHPELVHFAEVNTGFDLSSESDLLRVLGGPKIIDNVTYNIIPDGAEGIIKVVDNGSAQYYKYIWNGSSWVQFANQGSGGSSTTIVRVVSDSVLSFTSSDAASINELTSEQISTKYKTAHNLDTNANLSSGVEADVVFTDADNFETFRKYIYLNGEWRIVQGVQEYLITIPAYDSSLTWTENEVVSVSASSDIAVKKADTPGLVNVFISHQFNSQYVDAFVFEKNEVTGDIDGGGTDETEYGDRLLVPVTCFKSAENNQFKVKISLPVSSSVPTTYAITLQK